MIINIKRRLSNKFVRLKAGGYSFTSPVARILFISIVIFSLIITLNLSIWSDRHRPDDVLGIHLTSQQSSSNLSVLYNSEFFNTSLAIGKFYRASWSTPSVTERPWFFEGGNIRPSPKYSHKLALWPDDMSESDYGLPQSDRIVNQLMYVPPTREGESLAVKTILIFFGKAGVKLGQERFLDDRCPVSACSITDDVKRIDGVDAVLFKDRFAWPINGRRNLNQIWILYLLENPFHTMRFKSDDKNLFNWTATYRHDSDIVTPYGKFVHHRSLYDHFDTPSPIVIDNQSRPNVSYSKVFETEGDDEVRDKDQPLIAWFVSNCGARNGRLAYARELSKHIPVDIYGNCGPKKCQRHNKNCTEMLNTNYRYYLSFENANCRDYISEKFFDNALKHNVIPIVMGATKDDYIRSAPYNSFIHVNDFESPKHLATFLHQLNKDPVQLDRYNQWRYSKRFGGELINTFFWCRLCAMLHAPTKPSKSYQDIEKWWNADKVCLKTPTQRWDNPL